MTTTIAKRRAAAHPGSPELGAADLPGTQFLLKEAGSPSDLTIAKRVHWRTRVDAARARAKCSLLGDHCDDEGGGGGGCQGAATRGVSALGTRPPPPKTDAERIEDRDLARRVLEILTPQERKIVRLLAEGKSTRTIGMILGVCHSTIVAKMKVVRKRAALVAGG